jgi:hypothetical protein
MYQGHSCECGFEEPKKKRYEPKDDYIFKRRQEINGWLTQIQKMNEYLESAPSEIMRRSIVNMISISEKKLHELESQSQSLIREILEVPSDLRCQGYHPEHGNCTKIGTMSHFGSDSYFCRLHYQR